jgi:hypothetical protein
VCGNKNRPLFELPGEFEQRNKWLEIIGEFCGNFSKTPTNLYRPFCLYVYYKTKKF